MNKIEKIEKLMKVWKSSEKSARREDTFLHEYHSGGMYLGLKTALAVLKRSPNKVNKSNAKCYCDTAEEGDWPCKVCMANPDI